MEIQDASGPTSAKDYKRSKDYRSVQAHYGGAGQLLTIVPA
jgi:hypothetical protein